MLLIAHKLSTFLSIVKLLNVVNKHFITLDAELHKSSGRLRNSLN